VARLLPTPGAPMSCPAGTRCGTNTGATYWGGRKAGCPACTRASRRYNKQQAHRRATRGPAYIDATPAREHLIALNRAGGGADIGTWWFLEPAKTLGLSATQLRRIASGDIRRVWPKTLDAILSLSLDDYDTAGRLRDRLGYEGLVAALLDKGWTKSAIAKALGAQTPYLQRGKGEKVNIDTLRALRKLLAAPRPPEDLVTPPHGGWDAWWNQRPDHDGRRHYTRRGCWRRDCRLGECVDAHRLYQRDLYRPVTDDEVRAVAEQHMARQRATERKRQERAA
jgi:DNA-binding Xre family transcriptional regulator